MLEDIYQRKLSVIVSADIAGYAKLTELKETDTHNALHKRLELVREQVVLYNGQVFRIHGDGCLCAFDSVVSALKACLEIQHSIQFINSGLPESHQMWLRIGVHISEIILDKSEPYGNGVNVAVRLQHNANPGEILVSKKTIELLGDKKQFMFSRPRKFTLKNISCKVAARKLLGMEMLSDVTYKVPFWSVKMLKATAVVSVMTTFIMLYAHILNSYDINFLQSFVSKNERSAHVELRDRISSDQTDSIGTSKIIQDSESIASNYIEHRNDNIRRQVDDVTSKLSKIEDGLRAIKYEVALNNKDITAKLLAITDVVSNQQSKFMELSNQYSDYMLANFGYANELLPYEEQSNHFESIYSQEYVIDSIDSLDEANSEIIDRSQTETAEIFGCLSCVHSSSFANNKDNESVKLQRDNAILIGRISGVGAKLLHHKNSVIENYLYTHLQESIKESSLGARIEKFTQLAKQDKNQELNTPYFEELCANDVMLIASYELVVNQWTTDGTYLRFHHCQAKKTVIHLEKNLAPTVMNVAKPYLTDEAWRNVNKSVDYMIDKLVVSQDVEYL